ncbi:hypothetical protein EXW94_27260 [Enterobacter sp. JMULE2]|uniref:hypothetical protein n=1 Tax=Enterobacter sp. JMULE2 TaxID=2518340 RepID=UPI001575E04B|nr:hypothetical protein [Enterobacter sp. JMULE2]NTZ41295.1 hypothetical protein [Enterobacter sp. JMULE2]
MRAASTTALRGKGAPGSSPRLTGPTLPWPPAEGIDMALTHQLQQNPVNSHQRFPHPADTMANTSDARR